MSTFRAIALFGISALGGCAAAQFAANGPGPVTRATLHSGVVIQGPEGYCVDPGTSDNAFVLSAVTLFSCAHLAKSELAKPAGGYVMTATAGPGAVDNVGDLARFLISDAGRKILSGSDDAASVTVHRTGTTSVASYVDFTDTALPNHLGHRHWRGFVSVDGQIVMLSLYPGANGSVAGRAGERTIRDFTARVLQANRGGS